MDRKPIGSVLKDMLVMSPRTMQVGVLEAILVVGGGQHCSRGALVPPPDLHKPPCRPQATGDQNMM